MSDIKWIKVTTDIFDDEKILLIESLPDADSIIVIWFKLLCLAGKANNSGVFLMNDTIPYTDKMLATIFRRREATVTLALQTFEQFGMIEIVDNVITIPNWGKHQNLDQLEQKKDYMRNYMKNYREKQKQIACKTNSKTNSKTNVSSIEKEEDIEIEKDIEKEEGEEARSAPPVSEIQQIKDAWNAISFTDNIKEILPGTSRWNELQLTIHMYGFDTVMEAIGKVEESEYLHKKGHVRFDQYIHRDGVQKLIEGFYQEEYKKNKDGTVDSWLEEIRNA